MRLLIFALMACLVLGLAACERDTTFEPNGEQLVLTVPDAQGEAWYTDGVLYTSEPEHWDAHKNGDGTCWHWTHTNGRWFVRTCGLTLSEECYTPCGPFGAMCECGAGGPGGDW